MPFEGTTLYVILIIVAVVLIVSVMAFMASLYKRCPSDMILVVFGSVGKGRSAKCVHGGGTFVVPVFQQSSYMSLTPMTIGIPLKNALSQQNIRVDVPSAFTVGISTQPAIMNNTAERLLHLQRQQIEDLVREIIFGQLRLTVASLTIEQINQDRESFLELIRKNVEPELNKIGLYLINVNITDITDESDYIESIGKKAASEAINKAKVDVSVQDKLGAIGESEAVREREIRVAENVAQSHKGKKAAEADQRIFVQQQETQAAIGEAEANREKAIKIAENEAAAEMGRKKAAATQRIFVQAREAEAITGENSAKGQIADSNAVLLVKQAEAFQKGEVAKREAQVAIQKAQYSAEVERMTAEDVAKSEIARRQIEIAAEAEAEKRRLEAKGAADAVLYKYEAEAKGMRQILDNKAAGYAELVRACGGDAKAAATLLMVEKIEEIVKLQVEAISNIKIDKITVWDGGGHNGDGAGSTANFMRSLAGALPPLHEVSRMAGIELPEYMGKMTGSGVQTQPPAA